MRGGVPGGQVLPVAWLCRKYRFCASHRLVNPRLSPEENRQFYGKCTNPQGHGHNFEVEVAVEGVLEPRTGRVFDQGALDKIVDSQIIENLDHKNFNFDVRELSGQITTGENVTRTIWKMLTAQLPEGALQRVKLVMSPSNSFEYFGEEG